MLSQGAGSRIGIVVGVVCTLVSAFPAGAMSVSMWASEASPAPVGTAISWNAAAEDESGGTIWYRYRVRNPGASQFRTVRDYHPQSWFNWVPTDVEGSYEVEVTARNRVSGDTASGVSVFEVTSRVVGDTPVLTPTSNELVFLYSAPPCQPGSLLTASFISSDGFRQSTPPMDCVEGKSVNVYLAGLRSETEYIVQHTIQAPDGAVSRGAPLTLTTGALSFSPAITRALNESPKIRTQPVLVQNRLFQFSVATDPEGRVIWYVPERLQYLTRFEPGGYFFALIEDPQWDDTAQRLRLLDLAGNTVLETNAARINEQLDALGKHHITSFHHEARRLPNGKILVLAANERLLTDIQGPGEVDVIGDMILVLNNDLEIEWVWDAFEHLDVTRIAVLDEKCVPGGGGCPVMRLSASANDWLHGNSLALAPDGNIIYSARHQDWIIKIHYANGYGSGEVIWRLGKDGDFRIVSNDPQPWFSHQHDASYEEGDGASRILLFDNGNTRHFDDETVHSRGQVLEIDESTRTATLVLNVDLGDYAMALGSAQKLTSGHYHFNLGWMPNTFSQALEFDSAGNLVSRVETETQQYRSFRMLDLYTP